MFDTYTNGKLYLDNVEYHLNVIICGIERYTHTFYYDLSDFLVLEYEPYKIISNKIFCSVLIPRDKSLLYIKHESYRTKYFIIIEVCNGLYISNDNTFRFSNGLLHHNIKPALVTTYEKIWFNHGSIHRLDGPAMIECDCKSWFIHGSKVNKKDVELCSYYLKLYRSIINEVKYF